MKTKEGKSDLLIIEGEELSIPGRDYIQLLKAVLEKGALFRFQVKGFSMCPFIKCQDVLIVPPLNRGAFGLGNIVAFAHPLTENLVIHRMVSKQGNFYLFCFLCGKLCVPS